MVRSRLAHGVIRASTPRRAQCRACSGSIPAPILQYGTLKCIVPFNNRDGTPMKQPPRPALATDKVRFVGDPVAFVVAETLLQAKDAAEAVEVDIDRSAVVRPEEAARPGAPLLHEEAPGNVALDYHFGDSEQVAAAFAKAAHVTTLKLVNSRVVVNAMEPRARIGVTTGERTLHAARALAGRVRPARQHGGHPQGRAQAGSHPDRPCRRLVRHEVGAVSGICLRAARGARARPPGQVDRRALGKLRVRQPRPRPRAHRRARARCRRQLLAVRITNFGNMGGFLSQVAPMPSTLNTVKNVQSVYRTPLIEVSTKCVFTNTLHVRLSRRRPARGQLLHGAADRRRRRDGDRSPGAAPAQPDPAA